MSMIGRIKAHRSDPATYDPPSVDDMMDALLAAENLPEAGDDVIRASNTLMLMLTGDLQMSKLSLEAALRRTLNARNEWDNAVSKYNQTKEART